MSPDPRSGTVPMLERPSLTEQFRRLGRRVEGEPEPRFQVEDVLGMGATGSVYTMRDRNLRRAVAVKFLGDGQRPSPEDEIDHFIAEAQIMASLEHPNVLPVHEIGVNEAGQIFFTMKKIDGQSLGALIERSSPAARAAPLNDANALVTIVVGVCQALAYAHDRGIVHQDVKPENIMVGAYGEVLLVDWGSAARLREEAKPRLYGTPLYMSPEQARAESVSERSDVYCLGATLFHALLLRAPTWSDDTDEFWRMKRAGIIREPTPEERAAVPPALLDIALKALAPDPAARYPGAAPLLEDLRRYQAGLAVSAHRDTWGEAFARWHRRHWRALWGTVAAATITLALGAALYGEKLKEIATWGSPILVERFADDGWRQRFRMDPEGSFATREGRLVSTGGGHAHLVLPRKLWGPVAIEYEAEILPGAAPGDLSLSWSREIDPTQPEPMIDHYRFQVGAYDGSYTAITGPDGRHLSSSRFRPEVGRRYRIRAEIDDYRLSLSIDGRLVCQWTDTVRFDGGYLALFAMYPEKAFSDLRIYSRGLAQKVPATAIGDAFMRRQEYDAAFEQYQRIADVHAGTAVGREARYKQGLCRWQQRDQEGALRLWRDLDGTEYQPQVRLYAIDHRFGSGDRLGALGELEALYRDSDADLRERVAMRWGFYADELRAANDRAGVEACLALHDRLLRDEHVADINAANALHFLGRRQEILDRYPQQRLQCAEALLELGRLHEVVERYPDQRAIYFTAAFSSGEFELLHRLGDPFLPGHVLVKSGHLDEALARFPNEAPANWIALITLGRLDDVLALAPDEYWRAMALCFLGRAREALATEEPRIAAKALLTLGDYAGAVASAPPDAYEAQAGRMALALQAWIRGDAAAARELAAKIPAERFRHNEDSLFTDFIMPYLLHPGDRAAWDEAAKPALAWRWNDDQRVWYQARYLTGACDEAGFLAQPYRLDAEARLLLCQGLRSEREGRPAEALAAYRAFLAVPPWRRHEEIDPVADLFSRWRVEQLSR